MLHIADLSVSIHEQSILHNINLSLAPGAVHAIMGPNGSGKSTLAYALMGHPHYAITSGAIYIDGKNITDYNTSERAQLGLFLSFQQPPAIPGVDVLTFLKESHYAVTKQVVGIDIFKQSVLEHMRYLHIDESFIHRNLNEGFSGGQKKQFEMLQLLVLQPKIVILDEIDSGLDIDALQYVARGLHYACTKNPDMSVLLITHYQRILQYIQPDVVHVLCDGMIVNSGGADVVAELERKGYDGYRAKV